MRIPRVQVYLPDGPYARALCVVVVMGCAGANTGTTVSDTEPLSTTEPTTTASETVLTSVPLLTSEPVPSKSSVAGASHWLSADQRRRADQLISTFENSSTTIRYDYAENLGDGRGVTAGRAGFTTATCDALDVVRIYVAEVDDTPLTAFIPELEHLCDDTSDDTEQLPEAAFMQAWRTAANDARFRDAQDRIVDREYYVPAMEAADKLGLRSALARAELYDTAIQHGAGDDPDGLAAVIARTRSAVGDPDRIGEGVARRLFRSADRHPPQSSQHGDGQGVAGVDRSRGVHSPNRRRRQP